MVIDQKPVGLVDVCVVEAISVEAISVVVQPPLDQVEVEVEAVAVVAVGSLPDETYALDAALLDLVVSLNFGGGVEQARAIIGELQEYKTMEGCCFEPLLIDDIANCLSLVDLINTDSLTRVMAERLWKEARAADGIATRPRRRKAKKKR